MNRAETSNSSLPDLQRLNTAKIKYNSDDYKAVVSPQKRRPSWGDISHSPTRADFNYHYNLRQTGNTSGTKADAPLPQESKDSLTLLTKFDDEGVFYAGEKLRCTFTFINNFSGNSLAMNGTNPVGNAQVNDGLVVPDFGAAGEGFGVYELPEVYETFDDIPPEDEEGYDEFLVHPVDDGNEGDNESEPESVDSQDLSTGSTPDQNAQQSVTAHEPRGIVKASDVQRRISETEDQSYVGGFLSWLLPSITSPKLSTSEKSPQVEKNVSSPLETVPEVDINDSRETIEAVSTSKVDLEDVEELKENDIRMSQSRASHHSRETSVASESIKKKSSERRRSFSRGSARPGHSVQSSRNSFTSEVFSPNSSSSNQRNDSIGMDDRDRPPIFSSTIADAHAKKQSSNYISLAFVQLIGLLSVDNTHVKVKRSPKVKMEGGGYLTDDSNRIDYAKNVPIIMTSPSVLFGSLELPSSGDKKEFVYEMILPASLPPSYVKGRAVRITYKLVLGVQKNVMDKPHLINLYFRVFSGYKADGSCVEFSLQDPFVLNRKEDVNTFAVPSKQQLNLGGSLQRLSTATVDADVLNLIRNTNSFTINDSSAAINAPKIFTNYSLIDSNRARTIKMIERLIHKSVKANYIIATNNQQICAFKIARSSFKIGGVISGLLDFSSAQLPSFHYSVYLECEETYFMVPESTLLVTGKNTSFRRVISQYHDYIHLAERTSFSLCIPSVCTPQFKTDSFEVKWHLRFEFVVQRGRERVFDQNLISLPCAQVDQDIIEVSPHPSQENLSKDQLSRGTRKASSGNTDNVFMATVYVDHLKSQVEVDSFECTIPITVLGCEAEQGRLYPFKQKFVMMEVDEIS